MGGGGGAGERGAGLEMMQICEIFMLSRARNVSLFFLRGGGCLSGEMQGDGK